MNGVREVFPRGHARATGSLQHAGRLLGARPEAAVAADRLAGIGRLTGYLDLAPDLVVEVVGPSDRAADVVERARAWLAAGTRLVWVVHPAQRLVVVHEPSGTARHLSGADRLDGGDVLPDLVVEVSSLFT